MVCYSHKNIFRSETTENVAKRFHNGLDIKKKTSKEVLRE